MELVLGNLVYQLPRGVTLVYDLRFSHMIAHYKTIEEDLYFLGSNIPMEIIDVPDHEKISFRP